MENKKEDIQPVPSVTSEWQICPLCNGTKQLMYPVFNGTAINTFCNACNSHGLIVKPIASPSKESQKQSLIELMEADQRDGIYGVRGAVDNKIAALLVLTDEFIFPAYYSHTDKVMWKIANVYTKYNEETLVLCGLDEGIEAALDVAIKVISEKRKEYYGLPIEPNPDPQNAQKEPVIDNLRDKFFKECVDEVSIWEGETDKEPKMKKVNMTPHNVFEWFKPYLKSNSEPVIDWEGIEDGLYHLNIAEAWGPTDVVINWLKSNLSNYIKVK